MVNRCEPSCSSAFGCGKLFAVGSAFFADVTSILAKCGIRKTDSTMATAVRTVVVLIFSWIMVLAAGSLDQIGSIGADTLLFLPASSNPDRADGISVLFYDADQVMKRKPDGGRIVVGMHADQSRRLPEGFVRKKLHAASLVV